MSRRWKVITALGVPSLAAFLVWAFLSEPHHELALRFMGYETNAAPFKNVDISARFCLTNSGRRTIYCQTSDGIPSCRAETKTSEGWFNESGALPDGPSEAGIISLAPGRETCFTLLVLSPDGPFRVTVPYSTNHFPGIFGYLHKAASKPTAPSIPTKVRNRVLSWFRVDQGEPSASITIQGR